MKIKKTTTSKTKKLIIILLVVVLSITGYLTYAKYNNIWPFSGKPESSDQKSEGDSGDALNSDKASTSTEEDIDDIEIRESEKKSIIQNEKSPSEKDNRSAISGVVNYKSVVDNTLQIRVTIDQLLTSGSCSLVLKNQNKEVKRTANIASNPSSSTCQGFSIPISELSSGNWSIEVFVKDGGLSGKIADSIRI